MLLNKKFARFAKFVFEQRIVVIFSAGFSMSKFIYNKVYLYVYGTQVRLGSLSRTWLCSIFWLYSDECYTNEVASSMV